MSEHEFVRLTELDYLRALRAAVHRYFVAYYDKGERVERLRLLDAARTGMLQALYNVEAEFPRQERRRSDPPFYPLVFGFRLVFDYVSFPLGHVETLTGRRIEWGSWLREEKTLTIPAVLIQDRVPVEVSS